MRKFSSLLLVAVAFLFSLGVYAVTPRSYECGATVIYPIDDAVMNFSRELFPDDPETKRLMDAAYPRPSVPGSVNVFLLRHQGKWVLIDTGVASKESTIQTTLEQLRLVSSQVDIIIITHNHPDHVGNLMDNVGRPRFPKAQVWFPEAEARGASLHSSKADPNLKKISQAYLKRFKTYGDGEEILPGLKAMAAPGHSAGHMVLLLNEKALFIADLVHAGRWQFLNPELSCSYDADPDQAAASRIRFLEMAEDKGWVILGAHLPHPGIGTLEKIDDAGKPSFRFFTFQGEKF